MEKAKYINTDFKKTWQVVCYGKVISKHIDFYHAQNYIPILYKQGRIDNTYTIKPINEA